MQGAATQRHCYPLLSPATARRGVPRRWHVVLILSEGDAEPSVLVQRQGALSFPDAKAEFSGVLASAGKALLSPVMAARGEVP